MTLVVPRLSEIRMTPGDDGEEWHYVAEGELGFARNWPERASVWTGAFGRLRGADLN